MSSAATTAADPLPPAEQDVHYCAFLAVAHRNGAEARRGLTRHTGEPVLMVVQAKFRKEFNAKVLISTDQVVVDHEGTTVRRRLLLLQSG